ncbi:MBL fold metallo-hydrolase [Taibaiella koreensis]|uniref:MBL fold metallo-hydrolase n=1 Tax=Taibaiella koreensis TaxID=1268548 RepID=UPI000E59B3EB|nr:MBL fold metallo-hydrolase [Taibaiella koreensis]
MKISFHGAARTVTGSKHIVHLNPGKQVLLDCGMFQGMGKDTLRLNQEFGFDPKDIDIVIISHAHIDHIGLLPKLVKEGYQGKIYCTKATAALADVLLRDSAHIQEMDIKFANKVKAGKGKPPEEPLYTTEDAIKVFPLLEILPMDEWIHIDDQVELLYTDAGHIIGSACVHLKLKENGKTVRLTFSGDIGRYGDDILKSPAPFPQADYIIMESTYGDRLHPLSKPAADHLLTQIEETCLHKKGKLIIPAFSVGRTQELLYALNQLELENRLPRLDYFVDSPMSVATTEVVKKFPELFNSKVQEVLKKDEDPFMFNGLTMIEDVEISKALNFKKEPCVIISASGMAEAGRVKHHIANNIENPNNTILIVGYCEPESLGGRLRAGAKEVSIFGQEYRVLADVVVIESLSAHGDYEDMSQWLACQDPQQVRKLFLVHGEYDVQQKFSQRLQRKGFRDVEIPAQHQSIGLGDLG